MEIHIRIGYYLIHTSNNVFLNEGFQPTGDRHFINIRTGNKTHGTAEHLRPYFLQPGDVVLLKQKGIYEMSSIFKAKLDNEFYVKFLNPINGEELLLTFKEVEFMFVELVNKDSIGWT